MLKALVAGAAGKMGGKIIQMIDASQDVELAGAFERPDHPSVGKDVGEVAGVGKRGVIISGDLSEIIEGVEVIIDFTTPDATLRNIELCAQRRRPIVIGTTGIGDEGIRKIKEYSKDIACVMAPNMSVGVNVVFKIVREMALILGKDFDIEILEIHHNLKKDAPSGTALKIGKIIAEALDRDFDKVAVFERKGFTGKRSHEEIGIQSLRAGDITGDHMVLFGGTGERIELIHRSHGRENFAKGALMAAKWVVQRSPGLYDMWDVLGLR